jgi:hypothetical protein
MTITFLAPDGVAITAQQERQAKAALFGGGAIRPLGGRSGFRPGTDITTLVATTTQWTLKPCAAMIDPAATFHQGMYGWSSDADITGAVTAADVTYTRKDIVYIQINDSSAGDGSGATTAPVVYLAGTPSASPAAPALPARSFLIGTITVPQAGGGSPTVALNPARFVAAGGILPVFSLAERDALVKHDGLTVQRLDLTGFPMEVCSGVTWRPALGNVPFGHMGRTGASQSTNSTAVTVQMDAAQELRGGMTFDNATDSLVIPLTGLYRVTVKLYTTGSATGKHTCSISKVGSGGATIPGCAVQVNKSDSTDWFGDTTVTTPLTAGDKLYMAAASTSASNTWGTNGYDGTFLEVEYVGA